MLTYMRNKMVSIETPTKDVYVAYGFLDDHIYSLDITFQVNNGNMTIDWLKGHLNRYTTPDCPKAEAPLQEAVGLCLTDEAFNQSIHKIVGRKACRHFANLILECADAVVKTKKLSENPEEFDEANIHSPGVLESNAKGQNAISRKVSRPLRTENRSRVPFDQLEDAPGGFVIDLHVHTSPASPCASSTVEEIIGEAKRIGLNGICLTDHNYQWSPKDIKAIRERHHFPVLRGNEITTVQGDMVVFGLDEDIQGIITLNELAEKVAFVDGFMIAAHPFRGFLTVSGDSLGLDVAKAAARPMFHLVDGIETLNSKVNENENRFCGQVAEALEMPVSGGSDAHLAEEVGVYATRFSKIIHNEDELITALKAGDGVPVHFRQEQAGR
jgi:predicted metal-dependent phosphoesterase TrpH